MSAHRAQEGMGDPSARPLVVDWAYGEYDVPSLTVELRPASALEGGFILPASQIAPCWEENRPAALEFVRRVLEKPQVPA